MKTVFIYSCKDKNYTQLLKLLKYCKTKIKIKIVKGKTIDSVQFNKMNVYCIYSNIGNLK